ncbi:uncharacterized protein LOC111321659 isoform X2 [Stylophora pistillata]|uniref:uncharacterized protein LOC111321659 isoform X2 n=1 Tax=Stylophora pistillata TaxID=50429 RepID=UPI000C0465B6|nr:uncharacterized protein LOC111321659 isoform X2 [Stylophora pistillata]
MNNRYRRRLVALFTYIIGFSLIFSCTGLKSKHKKLRRSISKDIKSCKHWKFETADDPHFADISVKLHNAARSTKKMSVALQCTAMTKLQEPKSAFKVPARHTSRFAFRIAVASKYYHKDRTVRKYTCKLSTWTDDEHSLVTCEINVSVWPNGMFYYKCSSYQQGQLTVSQSTSLSARKINFYNKGESSVLLINSTCKPVALTLQLIDMYKQLDKGKSWTLELPLSCSGATSLNYRGKCSVEIFHVCREVKTQVDKKVFDLKDGEIEECEHAKSMLGKFAVSSFAASFGVNDDWSAALALTTIIELVLIVTTLVIKVIVVGLKKGRNSSREEFFDRFFKAARVTRGDSMDKIKEGGPRQFCQLKKYIFDKTLYQTCYRDIKEREILNRRLSGVLGTSGCCCCFFFKY